LYACKIKETANGRWRCAFGQARSTFQVIAQRRFARDVQIDEQSGAAPNGQDKAQRETDTKEAALGNRRRLRALILLQYLHDLLQRLGADPACSGKGMIKHVYQK
jgi:hypothetical protein